MSARIFTSAEEYDAIQALNWSTLKLLTQSPRALQYRAEIPQDDTEFLLRGRAIHCKALEPDQFDERYVITPNFGDLRKTENKKLRDEFKASVQGREVLEHKDGLIIERAAKALTEHPVACRLLEGKREQVLLWTDPSTGYPCKGRVDVTNTRTVDLKSTSAPSLHQVIAEAAKRDYHGQVAWYHDGAKHAGQTFSELPAAVFVQTIAPFDVVVLDMALEPTTFTEGQLLYQRLLDEYQGCKATNWWPGMAPDAVPWKLPKWKQQEQHD